MNARRYLITLLVALMPSIAAYALPVTQQRSFKELSWGELMPPADKTMVQQYNDGKLSRTQAMEYVKKLGETPVKALHNQLVEIPGYLVPLALDKDKKARELLLVPTLGACIHVPPPAPNQTIYVRYDKGIQVTEAGYTPYLLKGTLRIEMNSSEYTDTLYALEVKSIDIWE